MARMTPAYQEWVQQARCWGCLEYPCVCRLRSRTLPCACGGTVTADPDDPAQGVQLHQREAIHRLYRARFA